MHDDYAAITAWLQMYKPRVAPQLALSGTPRLQGPADSETRHRESEVPNSRSSGSDHTYRAYRKEAERLLLWALFERRKALSNLTSADCAEYAHFLAAPGPLWIGARSAQRWSSEWRPFEGPLAPRSRDAALTISRSLFRWLVQERYLDSDPWGRVPGLRRSRRVPTMHSLSPGQWELLRSWLGGLAREGQGGERLEAMFELAYATGMREAELASARVAWLHDDEDEDGHPAWTLRVIGKGDKEREIPLPDKVAERIRRHLAGKGIGEAIHDMDRDLPLLSALDDPGRPLTPGRIYELMKAAMQRLAQSLPVEQLRDAQRLMQASPHWLRHTHAKRVLGTGAKLGTVQALLGHESIETTGIYVRDGLHEMRRAMEKAFG